jgi:UDP-N-acetylglucosamine 4-epimerase
MKKTSILITGGAGFIGSNLCEYFLSTGNNVTCLDNLSTGFMDNMKDFIAHPDFKFIEGDIRDLETCKVAVKGCDYVMHQAALGSVPRSIKDPIASNETNINGFLNMLVASKDEGIKRFIYAASSSTYGDSKELPKVEERIGKPLSPYAITKYVNELYASVFSDLYGLETIGLRYFNVFGKHQDPEGAYAAVIPLWVKKMIRHESPIVNGDGSFSRDFTYIDNVVQANERAALTASKDIRERASLYNIDLTEDKTINMVFNVAFGGNITLNELFDSLKQNLSQFDPAIADIKIVHGPERMGDIPHSQASVIKIKRILEYDPQFDAKEGFKLACEWYFNNLKIS